jgi:hypothetical protein
MVNVVQPGVRKQLKRTVNRLEHLEAIPPMMPADMCSECAWPEEWQETGTTLSFIMDGCLKQPCPSWPKWQEQAKVGRARALKVSEDCHNPKL